MFNKKLYFTLIALLVISNVVCGKKSKKNKRPKDQEDTTTTIQPNVVAYSTFGFNDVGSYDGFVPTSPDYATFLSGVKQNQESSTRLYAPAFPSSLDSSGFGGNYGPQTFDGHSFGGNEDNMGQPGMSQYSSSSMNFFNNPNFGTTGEQNKNIDSDDTNGQNAEDSDAPVYGTKINSRHKYKAINPFNNTELNLFNNGYTNLADEKYLNFPDVVSTHENKPSHSESNGNYQNANTNVQNYDQSENENFGKPASSSVYNNVLKFPRVVDFTNLKPYPTELDTSKFFSGNNQPLSPQNSMKNIQMENTFSNTFNYDNNKFMDSSPKLVDHYNMKNYEESTDKSVTKSNSYFDQDKTYNHVNTRHKNNSQGSKLSEQKEKKKTKHKPWSSGNYSNDFTNWKDSSIKGYGYSTNYSNMNFKYDVSEPKKPFNPDEIVPASSNVVDLTNYQYPETDYSHFKKLPEFNEDDDYSSVSFKDKTKASEYLNQFKNSFSTVPTTTSYWGTGFKSADYSSFRDHPKKNHYSEINSDSDIVNIPKRPHKLSYPKAPETKLPDWPHSHHSRPHKLNRPTNDWQKDLFDTRYKSEEDLLGLRTHDTSHPTYLPTFKPSNNVFDNDNEFKNLVEKWRQSYLKTKYKDVPVRDYESYGSEQKLMHVPIPKPYPVSDTFLKIFVVINVNHHVVNNVYLAIYVYN